MKIDNIARPNEDAHGWGFKVATYHCEKCGQVYRRAMMISDEHVENAVNKQKCECENDG